MTEEEQKNSLRRNLTRSVLGLAEQATSGALGTLGEEGYPHTSLVEIFFEEPGHFWLLLSDLATHTKNLRRDVRASLLVADAIQTPQRVQSSGEKGPSDETLASHRATFLGKLIEFDHEREKISSRYVSHLPHARQFLGFKDFRFYRLRIEKVRAVAGFGRIGWLDAEDLKSS